MPTPTAPLFVAITMLLAACSRAPDLTTSMLIGRWELESPFSPEQRAAAIARGENPELWDKWADATTREERSQATPLYFDLRADGRASFPVFPPRYIASGADSRVLVMVQKEGQWEDNEEPGDATSFRVWFPHHADAPLSYSARFLNPGRMIVSDPHGPLTHRAWVRTSAK